MKKGVLLLILLLGLSLRVIGADWGFPFLLHPDEGVVANIPVEMAKSATLDPREYNHPDHFDVYSNALIYHAASRAVYGKPLTDTFAEHTLLFYHLSRIWAALLGTVCIWIAWLVGREFSERTGLIAALLVALFQPYVNNSHFITADIPLTLFILGAILSSLRYLKDPSWKNLLFGALASALSVSAKYPGLISLLLTLSTVAYVHYRDAAALARRGAAALGAFLVFLLLVSPYLILNFGEVLHAITVNAYPVHLGADALGWGGNVAFYAKTYLKNSGWLLFPFFLFGGYALARKEKALALPLLTGLLYWLVLSKIGLHWERWALPMYLTPLLVSSYGIDAAWSASERQGKKALALLCFAALVLIAGRLLVSSAATTAGFTLKDTRYASYLYAEKQGIRPEQTLYEGFTPFYPSNMRDGSVRNAFYTHDKGKDIRYVIVSSGLYDRYLGEKERYRAEALFYDQVFRLPLLAAFEPKEYLSGAQPFLLDNDLARQLAFLLDFARNRDRLLTGPSIKIYRYDRPGFLESLPPAAPAP